MIRMNNSAYSEITIIHTVCHFPYLCCIFMLRDVLPEYSLLSVPVSLSSHCCKTVISIVSFCQWYVSSSIVYFPVYRYTSDLCTERKTEGS